MTRTQLISPMADVGAWVLCWPKSAIEDTPAMLGAMAAAMMVALSLL
jgi:hypothetical protein